MKKFALAVTMALFGCGSTSPGNISLTQETSESADALAARGYVQTPHGFYHKSCVHELTDDATIDENGTVTDTNGASAALPECAYPHLRLHAAKTSGETSTNGWIEYSSWTSPTPATHATSHMLVPPAPSASADQLVYFFPGMQPADDTIILQPVLQWGSGPAGGSTNWGVASWSCGSKCVHSKYFAVAAGDTLLGTIAGSKCTSAGACNWKIVTEDLSTKKTTSLNTKGDKEPYVWLVSGVLEAYNVTACNQYPASGSILFSDVEFSDAQGNVLTPEWAPTVSDSLCTSAYGVKTTDTTATLKF